MTNMIGTEIIIETISMTDLLTKYGLYPTKQKIYRCPFHNDLNPSASVHKDKWFHCFACGINYNVVDFVAKYENCDKQTALKKICVLFNIGDEGELDYKEAEELRRKAAGLRSKWLSKQNEKQDRRAAISRVIDDLRLWESVQRDCHPSRGEIRKDDWAKEKLYFYALKQQAFLSWLYDRLAGHNTVESEFDDIYPFTSQELTNKILKEVGFLTL